MAKARTITVARSALGEAERIEFEEGGPRFRRKLMGRLKVAHCQGAEGVLHLAGHAPVPMDAQALVFFPSDTGYRYDHVRTLAPVACIRSFYLAAPSAPLDRSPSAVVVVTGDHADFRHAIDRFLEPESRLQAETELTEIVRRHVAVDDEPPGDRAPAALLRAEAFVQRHLADVISLADIAEAAGVSVWSVGRLFRAGRGLSPLEYQRARRIGLARRLLRSGQTPVEVAHQCGFFDQAHFGNAFREVTGTTPARYRAAFEASAPAQIVQDGDGAIRVP